MARPNATELMTRAGLNLIQQALSIYDSDLRLAVCNRPFQTMFGLPEHLTVPGASFEETIRYLVSTGEYGEVSDLEIGIYWGSHVLRHLVRVNADIRAFEEAECNQHQS